MDKIKRTLKKLVPPSIWEFARGNTHRQSFQPRWNELSFEPLRGTRLFFDPRGSWQQKILDGSYDSFLFAIIDSLAPRGKVIYDIGAHIGFHSVYFARQVGPSGRVIAFEPNKPNFERLVINIRGNPDLGSIIKPFSLAAADRVGKMKFTTNENIESGRSTGGFLDRSDPHWSKDVFIEKGFTDTSVDTVALADFPRSYSMPEPDIMKIDVEGAEHQVLLGARELIIRKKPVIFIEVHSIASMYHVLDYLSSLRYTAKLINKESNGVCYIQAEYKEQ